MKQTTLTLALLFALSCATTPPSNNPVHVVIVGTTDVHGWFDGNREKRADGTEIRNGGLATFASYVQALRAVNPETVVLVDSGDMFQGTLESNLFEGEPVIRGYNALGYTAVAVGNHEFDFGPVGPLPVARSATDDPLGALKKNTALARFPFLSANMKEKATGRTPEWARASTLVTAGGARIGIIGLSTPDTPNVTMAANVTTLDFNDPVAATITAANELRQRGADAIVVIAHIGGRCTDLSDPMNPASCEPQQGVMSLVNALPPDTVDVFLAGHTHSQMRHFINGVAVVQSLANSREFSTVDLWIDPATHRVLDERTVIRPPTPICVEVVEGTERCDARAGTPEARVVPRTFEGRTISRDPAVQAIFAPYLEQVEVRKNTPLGIQTAERLTRNYSAESALGNLMADAMRQGLKTDIAFMNSGGIRADLRAGELVYKDIFEVSPFDNYPAVARMNGAQIVQMLQRTSGGDRGILQSSGLRYTIDAARDAEKPAGQRNRVVSVTMPDGTSIDLTKVYSVVMPDFLVGGGEGLAALMKSLPPGSIVLHHEQPIRDLVTAALKTWPQPVGAKVEGRITIVNAPPK